MKKRTNGFIAEDKIGHDSEIFDYIRELHGYLWRFVRCELPGASGHLCDFLDRAIENREHRVKGRCKIMEAICSKFKLGKKLW